MEPADNIGLTISPTQYLCTMEMGRDDVNVVCSHGKISVWFGRTVPATLIWKVLTCISNVDKLAVHEKEITCCFDDITLYEGYGFVLISYAKFEGGYRATFNVPFLNNKALIYLADSIFKELKEKNVLIDIYWTGGYANIIRLHRELSIIEQWKLKNITYKDESRGTSDF
ncbi:hypothetical protein [Methanomethylovorans sp.]|uniref:hypothetical protein n=2 Tax=Methanomethylovorans sp. TaxID=2758717 RepID=UPI000A3F3B56|nr:hypothetical protein [Methanomethylovorans sp.]